MVRIVRGTTNRYHSTLRRADGVVIAFDGGSYNRIGPPHPFLPHDAAHLIVEAHLGLDRGVWATLAAGGLFGQVTVLEGRQKPHARERGRELVRRNREHVMEAEHETRAACDALADGTPLDPGLAKQLREAAARWAGLDPGEALEFSLPAAW